MTQVDACFDAESRQKIGKVCSSKVRTLPKHVYLTKGHPYFRKGGEPNRRLRAAVGTPEFDAEYAECLAGIAAKITPFDQFRAPDGTCHFHAMEKAARARAVKNGREFALPPGWMRAQFEAQGRKCAVSLIPFSKDRSKHAPYAPSIDRKDSSKGYTPDNCRLVAYIVNCAKNQFTDAEFIQMCRAVVARRG